MAFSTLSILLRSISGASIYLGSITLVEGMRAWFPDSFQIVSSLVTGTASYIGYGTFSFIGAISYDGHGYQAPYLILAAFILLVMLLCILVLPRNNQPVSSFKPLTEEKSPLTPLTPDALSPLVFLPITGQFLVNMASGYCLATVIPYLVECCGVSNSRASTLILTNSLAIAAGFIIAGNLYF